MRYFFSIFCFCLLSQVLSCQEQPTQQNPEDGLLWKAPISSQLTEGEFPKFLYNNAIIAHATRRGDNVLVALNKNSGKELWTWSDKLDGHGIRTKEVHQYNNILVWRYAGRIYGINLNNGQTLWKERVIPQRGAWFGSDWVSGLGEAIMFNTGDKEYFSGYTSKGNFHQYPTFPVRAREETYASTTLLLNAPPYRIDTVALNDTLALLPFATFKEIGFVLFNFTRNKEIYTTTIPGDTSGIFSMPPILHQDKIFFAAGTLIHAYDFKTGKLLWKERFPSFMSGSGIIYHDGMIIGNCEDTFMYALDAKTGKQLWATKTSGTSSRLFEMNGVIYFTGGGDGLLHAVDAKTGKHIWKKESPDLQRNSGASFFDSVTGADGKIYVSSYLSLFCYKAAR